jgi:chromosome segregation ATPase
MTLELEASQLQEDNNNHVERIKILEEEIAEWEKRYYDLDKQVSVFEDRVNALKIAFAAIDLGSTP